MSRILVAAILAAAIASPSAHEAKPRAGHAVDHAKAEETPFGRAADPRAATRTVRIDMSDEMRFRPAEIRIRRGEVIRLVPVNRGKVMHEMVLGTMADLRQHSELMRRHPHMEHEEAHMAHVAPGKRGEIGWQFTRAGEFYYGCLIPGHFEAGMVGRVTVTD